MTSKMLSGDLVELLRSKYNILVPGGPSGLIISEGTSLSLETNLMVIGGCDILGDVFIGSFSYCNSVITGVKSIGRYCSIAKNVNFNAMKHPIDRVTSSPCTYDSTGYFDFIINGFSTKQVPWDGLNNRGVVIGNDVWIGEGAVIMPGISIGDGAVVGSRAVVTKNVPPYHIVAGVPAKTIRLRFDESVVDELLKIKP